MYCVCVSPICLYLHLPARLPLCAESVFVLRVCLRVTQDRTLAIDASLARLLKRDLALPFAELARRCVADVRARVLRPDEADPTATQVWYPFSGTEQLISSVLIVLVCF